MAHSTQHQEEDGFCHSPALCRGLAVCYARKVAVNPPLILEKGIIDKKTHTAVSALALVGVSPARTFRRRRLIIYVETASDTDGLPIQLPVNSLFLHGTFPQLCKRPKPYVVAGHIF